MSFATLKAYLNAGVCTQGSQVSQWRAYKKVAMDMEEQAAASDKIRRDKFMLRNR